MRIDCEPFRVAEGAEAGLSRRPTTIKPLYESGKHYRKLIEEKIAELTVQHTAKINKQVPANLAKSYMETLDKYSTILTTCFVNKLNPTQFIIEILLR